MHHTHITIDISNYGTWDPSILLWDIDKLIAEHPIEFEDWKVRVLQEHNGKITPVPGYTTPEGVRE